MERCNSRATPGEIFREKGREAQHWLIRLRFTQRRLVIIRVRIIARIITTLAGRATEQVIFGDPEVTTGASGDLQQVTNLARQMVTRFGMSNIGPIALEDESNGQVFLGATMDQGSNYPETIADRIDDEVCKIINYCEQKSIEIMEDNRVVIDLIVEKLMDEETIDGDEFRKLLSTYTVLPDKNAPYISKFENLSKIN